MKTKSLLCFILATDPGGVAADAQVEVAVDSQALSRETPLKLLTADGVVDLLQEWGLDGPFAESFEKHQVTGEQLHSFFKKGRVDESTFAPGAQPYQWDMLWANIGALRISNQGRRSLADAVDSMSGIAIKKDDAGISFGAEDDVVLARSGAGTINVYGSITVADENDATTHYKLIDERQLEEIQTALSNRKCTDGLTGDNCDEQCTKKLYYASAGCLYHNTPSTELQVWEAAPFIGWYDPAYESATVQCCDDDTCTRKDDNGDCWMGSYDTEDPFATWVTWQEAYDMCDAAGMRLCSQEEMETEGHGCCGGGCSYDYTVTWTSTFEYDC